MLAHHAAASQLHTRTHTHTQALATLSATTQLATVCVLPSSLLQASRSALRQGKPTHTLSYTHTLLAAPLPYFFGREEMRREQRQGGVALFASSHSCRAAVKSGRLQISQGFHCFVLKVVSKRFGVSSLKRGKMQQNRRNQNLERRTKFLGVARGTWTYVEDFGSVQLVFLFFLVFSGWKHEGGNHSRGSPLLLLGNSFAAFDLVGSASADSPAACQPARWHSTPAALVPGYRRGRA